MTGRVNIKKRRVILVILDGVGVGELPDAGSYRDIGSNTLGNIAKLMGGISLPNLEKLGLGNIIPIEGVTPLSAPLASFGKMMEHSPGKDSTTGHWEIAGVFLEEPFPTYPKGFPEEIINRFEKEIRRKTLGNKVASGTEILKELGDEHLKTGFPIIYTSADSVFQIACHEGVVSVSELYKYCETARKILVGEHGVARVIARPFVGRSGGYVRTQSRRDFSLLPPCPTLLDKLNEKGIQVIGIGKIEDLFSGRGLSCSIHTDGNKDGIDKIIKVLEQSEEGFIFVNLIDFDMVFGHRNNAEGFYSCLKEFDSGLSLILEKLEPPDILIITADHGNDPTTESTDHSREYVPLLVYDPLNIRGRGLGIRESFADVGASIGKIFGIKMENGISFL